MGGLRAKLSLSCRTIRVWPSPRIGRSSACQGRSEKCGRVESSGRQVRGYEGGASVATKLFVGGLSYSTTSESLREYFAQCGTVESATVITDRATGQSRGFGFVEMATEAEGQSAISKLNDKPFEGRRLTVNVANPQGAGGGRSGGSRPGGPRSGGGFGGGGGGYGGGPRRTPRW